MVAIVRPDGSRPDLIEGLRNTLRVVDPTLPVRGLEHLTVLVGEFSARTRFAATQIGLFGGLGLFLSGLGLYALVARVVSARLREYGIRLAIGASLGSLVGLVVRSAVLPAAIGGGLGLVLAVPVALGLRSQLFEVAPWDPASHALGPIVLLVVALTAALACARRALRAESLRSSVGASMI